MSVLIGATIFFHMGKKSYERFDWLTFSYPKKFNTCLQANVNMEPDFVNLLRFMIFCRLKISKDHEEVHLWFH